jgi:serine/threonine-protein kinase
MDYDAVIAQFGSQLTLNPIEEYSAEHEKRLVMRQSVLQGRPVRTGQRIDIWVSKGPQLVELNNYEGGVHQIEEVKTRLRRQGFLDANIFVRNEESSTVPSGFVIRTDPPAGSMVSLDERITVFVSYGGGNDMTQAPDLVGLTKIHAEERARMFDVIILFLEEYSDTVAIDRIISQDPAPLMPVERMSTVEVIISIGPQPSRAFTIEHDITRASITGDYVFEYYIDGNKQEHLTKTQNIGLNRRIDWTVEGTGVQRYVIFITSVETGRRLQFCEYEVDFSSAPPTRRINQLNDRIFTELDAPVVTTPEPNPEPAAESPAAESPAAESNTDNNDDE